jgi:hypothetical protein
VLGRISYFRAEVFYREKPHALAPQLAPDASGIIWMPDEGFELAFPPKASPEQMARRPLVRFELRPESRECLGATPSAG